MFAAAILLCLAQTSQPDVLLIIVDDVGQEPAGAAWSVRPPRLPSLDALAAAGTTFSRAYASPVCCATRAGLFSGLWPRRVPAIRGFNTPSQRTVGVGDLGFDAHDAAADRLPLELLLLPEALQLTHETFFTGKWHLGRAPVTGLLNQVSSGPFCQGFSVCRGMNPTAPAVGPMASGHYGWHRVSQGQMNLITAYATDVQRNELLTWWSATAGPKFAVLSTSLAHAPHDPPPGFGDAPTDREDYENGLAYLDAVIAEVLAAVDLDTTYVVFTADNGCPDAVRPPGTPTGYWKGSTYEGGVRVPLVVAGPGVAQGGVSPRLVSTVDLPATLLELLCLPRGGGFADSVSFADELGAGWIGEPAREFVLTERYDVQTMAEGFPIGYDDVAIVRKTWKYRRWDADGNGPGGFAETLYNLANDPYELAPKSPAQVPGVHATLAADLASVPPRL